MLIAPEVMIPRFAKIRQYAVKSLNYSRAYLVQQLGAAYPGLSFEILSWERKTRSLAKVVIKVTKEDQTQIIEFEHPCKRVPSITALTLPKLSKSRAVWARH